MSDVNRHVKWPYWPVVVEVRGSTVIEKGDLLFLDRRDNLRNRGSSTANQTAYPFAKLSGPSKTLANNQYLAAYHFLGVAVYDSKTGVTEKLAVGITGHFRFPLKSPKTYKLSSVVMPAGSGITLYNQKAIMWASGATYALGYATKGKVRGSDVTFLLKPAVITHGKKI